MFSQYVNYAYQVCFCPIFSACLLVMIIGFFILLACAVLLLTAFVCCFVPAYLFLMFLHITFYGLDMLFGVFL